MTDTTKKFVIKELHKGQYFYRITKLIPYAYPPDCIVRYAAKEYALTYNTREDAQKRADQLAERYPVNMYFEGPMEYVVEEF